MTLILNLNIKLKIFLNNRQKYLPTFYAINTEQFSNFDFLCSNDKLGEQYPQIRLLSDLAIAAEELYQDCNTYSVGCTVRMAFECLVNCVCDCYSFEPIKSKFYNEIDYIETIKYFKQDYNLRNVITPEIYSNFHILRKECNNMSHYNCFAMKENSSIEWFSANLCLLKLLHELCVWFYKICLKQNKTKIPIFKEPQKIISGNQITINKDNEIEKLKESLDVAKKETEFYKERNQNEVEKTKNATTNSDKELSAIINNLQENCIESKKLAQSYLLKNIELEEENKKLRLKNNKLEKEQSTAKIVNFPNNTKSKGDSSKSILLKAIKQMGTTKAFITQNMLFDFLYGNKRQITYSYKLNELSMFGQYKMPRNSYNIILQELLDDNKIKFNGCYIQFTEN